MSNTTSINCRGLSTAITLLRIRQALITVTGKKTQPLTVAVSQQCDRNQVMQSLGAQANIVQLV